MYKKTLIKICFLISLLCLVFNGSLFSQVTEKQKLLDSLIVNRWKTEKVIVGTDTLKLNKVQVESRLVISSNHIAQNISDGNTETGKWEIDAVNMKLIIHFGAALKIEPLRFSIIKLEKNKLIISVADDESDHPTIFECVSD